MDIIPNGIGAQVDLTDEAEYMVDRLADAFAGREVYLSQLLVELAEARGRLKTLKLDADTVSRDIADWRIEHAASEVDAIRELITGALDPTDRVTVQLMQPGCERRARELQAAADQTIAAQVSRDRAIKFPSQQDRRAA
jgi:hypothetical protein